MKVLHWLSHRLGLNTGQVETWWEQDGSTERLMVGFKCDGCGVIEGAHERFRQTFPAKPYPPEFHAQAQERVRGRQSACTPEIIEEFNDPSLPEVAGDLDARPR